MKEEILRLHTFTLKVIRIEDGNVYCDYGDCVAKIPLAIFDAFTKNQ
jgi:hypothetical protein